MELHSAVTSTPHSEGAHARLLEWATFHGVACFTIPFGTISPPLQALLSGSSPLCRHPDISLIATLATRGLEKTYMLD